ncbi:FAD-binding protein [Skermania sp. ID1734]|uniref:D-arabinono-1,4-lactone oxidase n=1 Tax=Skermania sp. ID1734 TaxID=2597516 RepID=UPI00117D5A5B|nr:D-arabinono-1,4-lactone oxidase [Skermania sp. ID1734]TSD97219.1 FAD-binding protein [Skermania sp. ID1734]
MTNSWTNWAGDQSCRPAALAVPRSRSEVADLVANASAIGQRVRVAGAGHSFTDAVLTDGLLLRLDQLDRVLDVDQASGLVRVEGGITLHRLNSVLHEYGLAMPNLGDIDVQTVAGATATATHGTGARLPNLSAALHSIELTLADGRVIEVDENSDPEAWRAARVSLGALGVVTAVTLQTVPAFVLEAVERPLAIDDVLADLDAYVDGNDHFEFFAFGHSPIALTKRNNRTSQPEKPRSAAMRWLDETFVQNTVFGAVVALGRRRPSLIPVLNRTAARVAGHAHSIDRSYRVFVTPRMVKMTEMEYALPREHSVDAIRQIKKLTDRAGLDTPFPMEVRWVAGDDAYLSPAYARDTCYIAVHMARGMAWEPYFRAAEEIFDSFGGRPHWGKRHFQTAATLRSRYPEWERFADVRRRLDPTGTFGNAYVDRVLGTA